MPAPSLTRGELISAASALLLLVVLVVFAWYGVEGIPGRSGSRGRITTTETGWEGLTGVRWLILLTVLVAICAVVVHAAHPPRQTVAGLRLALLVLATGTAVALIVRVLIDLPASDRVADQKLGALLGLAAALGVAYGASEAIREQRARLAMTPAPSGEAGTDAEASNGPK